MDDLTVWLRAQLDEEERVAREATPGPWQALENAEGDGCSIAPGVAWPGYDVRSGVDRLADAEHIARHDPARVLAEVDAKRRILDLRDSLKRRVRSGGYDTDQYALAALEVVISHMALPFADCPGYRDEWKP